MLLLRRPPKPANFAQKVRKARRAVKAAILADHPPDFPAIWTEFKDHFIQAQHGKCGYCEVHSLNHPGAVDHHAPKGAVHELVDKGSELRNSQNVRGRRVKVISTTGYWWLAYSWENWIFVCERCNTGWKQGLFPVAEKRRRPIPPAPGAPETPLLLNPFGREDPIHHLRFHETGQIAAYRRSPEGRATINTCGLDRESLRFVRQHTAGRAYNHIRILRKGLANDNWDRAMDAVENLLDLGKETAAQAGMVRSIVKNELEMHWDELQMLKEGIARRKRDGSRRPLPYPMAS